MSTPVEEQTSLLVSHEAAVVKNAGEDVKKLALKGRRISCCTLQFSSATFELDFVRDCLVLPKASVLGTTFFALLAILVSSANSIYLQANPEAPVLELLPYAEFLWLILLCLFACIYCAKGFTLRPKTHSLLTAALFIVVAIARLALFPGFLGWTLEAGEEGSINAAVIAPYGLVAVEDESLIRYVLTSSFLFTVLLPFALGIKWILAGPISLVLFVLHTIGLEYQTHRAIGGGLFEGGVPTLLTIDVFAGEAWLQYLLPMQLAFWLLLCFAEWSARQRYRTRIEWCDDFLMSQVVTLQADSSANRFRRSAASVLAEVMQQPLSVLGSAVQTMSKGNAAKNYWNCHKSIESGLQDIADILVEGDALRPGEMHAFVLPDLLRMAGAQISQHNRDVNPVHFVCSTDAGFSQAIVGDSVRLQQIVLGTAMIFVRALKKREENATSLHTLSVAASVKLEEGRDTVLIELTSNQALSANAVKLLEVGLVTTSDTDVDNDLAMIMSICRRLVHTLPNGQIGVQNKEGGGEGSLWISFDLQWARPAHDEDIFLRFQEQKDSPASGKKKAGGGGKSEAEEKAAAPEEVRQGRSPIRQPVFQVRDDASASAAAEFAWPSHELDEVLQLVTRLGSGASGDVWVARHNVDKFHVAVQLLSVNTDNVESANNVEASKEEVAKLVTYRHPCLVRYHHLWGPDAKNCMWLVMDLCEKRSVSHLLRATGSLLTERQLAHILSVALHGLEHLHNARSQLHQDVRPGTLFVTGSGRIKLGGYWSRLASERHDGSEEVEPAAELDTEAMLRRPPEVLQGQPFTYASDVWALGLAALELAEGKLPHSKLSASLITKAIVNGSPPALKLPFWSSKFRHFVRMCLLKDPNHRPVTGDLLSHPFILSAPGPECIKPLLVRLRYLPKSSPVLGSAAILRYHVASDQGDKASAPSAEHSFTSNSISERSNNAPTSNTQSQSLSTRWAAPDGLPSVLKQPTSVIYSKFSPKTSKGGSTNMTLSDIEDEVEGIGALEIPPSPPKRNPPPSPPKRRPPAH